MISFSVQRAIKNGYPSGYPFFMVSERVPSSMASEPSLCLPQNNITKIILENNSNCDML